MFEDLARKSPARPRRWLELIGIDMTNSDARHFARLSVIGAITVILSGCASRNGLIATEISSTSAEYAQLIDGPHTIPAVDISAIDSEMLRQRVDYPIGEPVGTIVVDTAARHLYLVEGGRKAMRYGIGVG